MSCDLSLFSLCFPMVLGKTYRASAWAQNSPIMIRDNVARLKIGSCIAP